MSRLLILLGLLVVVVWWVLHRIQSRRDDPPAVPRQHGDAGRVPEASQMVACAHCGVMLPRTETVVDAAGRVFCGDEHRLAGPRRTP